MIPHPRKRKEDRGRGGAYHSLRRTILPFVQSPYCGSRCLVFSRYCSSSLFISSGLASTRVMHDKTAIVATKKIERNMPDRRRLARESTECSNDSESSRYLLLDQALNDYQTGGIICIFLEAPRLQWRWRCWLAGSIFFEPAEIRHGKHRQGKHRHGKRDRSRPSAW